MDDATLERIVRMETEQRNMNKRLESVEDTTKMIYDINANMKVLVNEMKEINENHKESNKSIKEDIKNIREDVSSVKSEIDIVKQAPANEKANKFDKVSWLVLSSIITAILGFVIGMVLK